MTKAEKIGILFSAAALIISIISPIATYLWLDPSLKAFKDRARLQAYFYISSLEKLKKPGSAGPDFFGRDVDSDLKITNTGKLPAKDIQIVLQYNYDLQQPYSPPKEDFLTIDPPTQYEIHTEGHESFITIKRPLPSKQSLTLKLKVIPSTMSVSSEYGETNVISISNLSSLGWLFTPPENGGKQSQPRKKR